MKLRQLFEDPQKKVAVAAFGRMNPPTIGHEKLVDKVKSFEGDHYIFLSQTQKPKDNPLPFDVKLEFAKKFFPGVNVGHPSVRTPIQMLQMLEKLGYTDIIYVAGSDRVTQFEKLFNDYNGKEYNFNSITVENAGERDPDAEGAEGMSASKMRAAAASGDYEAFAQGVPTPALAQKMYDAVRTGMGIKDVEPVEEAQLNEAFPLLIPALATAIRLGAPAVGRLLSKQGAKQVAKQVAKNTGKAAVVTGKTVVKNPGKSLAAYGAYEVWDTVNDAIEFLEGLGLDEALIPNVAKVIVRYGIPAAAVLAALYGGKKLYDYIKDNNEPEEADILAALEKEYSESKIKESDLVLDKSSLVPYLRDMISDYLDKENDIQKLSSILKMLVGKEIKTRGNRYVITKEAVVEACKYGTYYCSTDKKEKCRKGPKQSRSS